MYALTSYDAWRVVKSFSDYSFPRKVVRRIGSAKSIRFAATKALTGEEDKKLKKNTTPIDFNDGRVKIGSRTYRVCGYVVHRGGLGGGHYRAFFEVDGQWIHFDDSLFEKEETPFRNAGQAYLVYLKECKLDAS